MADLKPELSEPFPNTPPIWTCPVTGLKVPKHYQANLDYRAALLAKAESDTGLQREILAACRDSLLYWTNSFAFTFKLRDVNADGNTVNSRTAHVPYITWEIQDRHLIAIEDAIENQYDLLTDKSRDMGASWDHIYVLEHQFLFLPDRMFLELSRTEEYVDRSDNPKCLFWKHRYIRKWLPKWMLPPIHDVAMHFTNLANNSKIDGESANANAASGDRRRAVLLDEFAKVEQGGKIRSATADVSGCRLINSTQAGPGTAYSKWRRSGQARIFIMPWWEHPEKGRGRNVVYDETTKAYDITAPWLEKERERRSPQEVDQEILMKDIDQGATFFDAMPITQHIATLAKPANFTRAIDFKIGTPQDHMAEIIRKKQYKPYVNITPQGPWRFWMAADSGRPDQTKSYVFGVDISKGQGASNSVVSVLCVQTREKVAEFADATVPPYDLAKIVAAAGMWFGGAQGKLPLVNWEINGPGVDFGKVLVRKLCYPNIYMDRVIGTVTEKRTRKYGWHSSQPKKEELLGALRRAYAHGGIINRSTEALEEALMYVYYSDGGLGPAEFSRESQEAKLTHGDRVIADALALLAIGETPNYQKKGGPTPPRRSIGSRRELALANRTTHVVQWGNTVNLASGRPEFRMKANYGR